MNIEHLKERIQVIRDCGDYEDALLWEFIEEVAAFGHIENSGLDKQAELLLDWRRESEDDSRWCA